MNNPLRFPLEPMKKTKKGPRIVTEAQREARKANIVAFNQSGTPGALKHGTQSAAVRKGQLPPGNDDLQKLVDSFYKGWLEDLGGEANLTSAKRALLWVSRGNLAVFALGLRYIEQHGLVDAKGDVQSVAKVLATYGNSLRLNLVSVGLDRTPRDAKTLEVKLREIAEREHAEAEASVSES
jgi:hypothetical protein